jgi:hypothetical protein
MGGGKIKACEEKKRATKLARSTSLIGLNSQLKLNLKILRTWKKEMKSFRSLNAQGIRGGGTPSHPFYRGVKWRACNTPIVK